MAFILEVLSLYTVIILVVEEDCVKMNFKKSSKNQQFTERIERCSTMDNVYGIIQRDINIFKCISNIVCLHRLHFGLIFRTSKWIFFFKSSKCVQFN